MDQVFEAVGGTESYDRTDVTGCISWVDSADTLGQRVSDERTEQFTRNSGRAGFDPFGVVDCTSGHARQTVSAWTDLGSTGLYYGVETCQPQKGTFLPEFTSFKPFFVTIG